MINVDTDVSALLTEAKISLNNVLNGEFFTVGDLFRRVEWQRIPLTKRLQLGARFFGEVNKGAITGIKPITRTPRTQQRYWKQIPGFADDVKGFW